MDIDSTQTPNMGHDHSALSPKTIVYNADQLHAIRLNMQQNHHAQQLPFGAIRKIRELRINNTTKYRITSKKERPTIKQQGVNRSNLISIGKQDIRKCNIIGSTCNVQSIKNKDLMVSELIQDYSLDFLVTTETWLNDTEQDNQWLNNKDDLRLLPSNRKGKRGGGLALIAKSQYKPKCLKQGSNHSFEYALWTIQVRNTKITLLGIYHPPYSLKNKCTNTMFLDDFMDFATRLIPDHDNIVILGDFNLHISERENAEVNPAIFMDTCEAMGLYQHVYSPTHKAGNTLDLVLSDISEKIGVNTVTTGPFISDHCAVIFTLSIKKPAPAIKTQLIRRTKDITPEQWANELNTENIVITDKLEETTASLESELSRVMDTLAPLKKVTTTLRPKKPWYTDKLRETKCSVRKREHKW